MSRGGEGEGVVCVWNGAMADSVQAEGDASLVWLCDLSGAGLGLRLNTDRSAVSERLFA